MVLAKPCLRDALLQIFGCLCYTYTYELRY